MLGSFSSLRRLGEIERFAIEDDLAVPDPLAGVAIPGQLEAVQFWIMQVERLVGAVVGRAVDLPAVVVEPLERGSEIAPLRVVDREVVETGRTWRWRVTGLAFPRVHADVVVIAAGREEGGLIAEPHQQVEAEEIAVEADLAIEIADLEVDVPDPGAGRDRRFAHGYRPFTIRESRR